MAEAERLNIYQTGTPQALRDLGTESEMAGTGASARKGLVPSPGAGATTNRYLNETGIWVQASLGEITGFPASVSMHGFQDGIYNAGFTTEISGGSLTVRLKTKAATDPSATDPVYLYTKTAETSGGYEALSITAALSFTISSGSNLGTQNGKAFRVWVVLFNDAGTPRLGVYQSLSWATAAIPLYVKPLTEWLAITSVAEGGAGAADSAGVYYTGSAVAAKFCRILGYFEYTTGLTTAGTWDALPARHQLFDNSVKKPGDTVQGTWIYASVSAQTAGTAIPSDNSIPLITEGDQIIAVAITPANACNIIGVESDIHWTPGAAVNATSAMFIEGVTNAIAAKGQFGGAATQGHQGHLWAQVIASVETSVTYSTRIGAAAGTVFAFNSPNYGGAGNSFMRATEVAV